VNDYVVFTDSACDISTRLLQKWGVHCVDMTFSFVGETGEYINEDVPNHEFYDRMRKGAHPQTAAINAHAFSEAFSPILEEGKDILYVAFSSVLSTTFQSACMAVEELKVRYPARNIAVVDTLSASAGGGMIVYMAVERRNSGAGFEENAAYLRELVKKQCVWFTVEDLEYLKRGGRINPAVAFVGSLLGIKPVLKVNGEGYLEKVSTVRGKNKAIEELANRYGSLAVRDLEMPIFISHADCLEDAQALEDILRQRYDAEVTLIADIGPVVGSHVGPGALAIFFIGEHR